MISLSYEQIEEIGLKEMRERLETVSPFGKKRLRSEGFYVADRLAELEAEFDNIECLRAALRSDAGLMTALRHALSGFKDISGSLMRCESETLSEVELFELTAYCRRLTELIPLVRAIPGSEALSGIMLLPVEETLDILQPGGGPVSFYIEDVRSPELAAARKEKRAAERALREAGGNDEVMLFRRQEAVRREEGALEKIYEQMSSALRPHLPLLKTDAEAIGRLDGALAKALLAEKAGLIRPSLGGETLCLTGAVHPLVAEALSEKGRLFAPISAELPKGVTVLTGANMGGKSIALKTIVLNTALALSGCFVCAKQAQIPLFDRIELINRDFSDEKQGLSSFGGEILCFNEAAARLSEGGLSLILMDEFARGTNAQEGERIACGAVRYLQKKNAVTLFATHYDGAAKDAAAHYQVRGLTGLKERKEKITAGQDGLRAIALAMDYGLEPVASRESCPHDAIAICRLLGLPEEILSEESDR